MSAGNSLMQLEQGAGWTRGLRNLLRAELADWFATRTWWTQIIIWGLIVNGTLLVATLSAKGQTDLAEMGITVFNAILGLGGPIGVAIIMMNAVVQEKRSGTAAWVLSKPVSRQAFIAGKLIANGLGVAASMVAAQGVLGYLILALLAHASLPPLGFVAALGVHVLNLMFFLTLTTMLGALFSHPGPVVGLPIAFGSLQQFLGGLGPVVASLIPYALIGPGGEGAASTAVALMSGQPAPSLVPVIAVAIESIIFSAVAVWGFSREEL